MKVSVSFLKSKLSMEETLKKLDNTDADFIHVDIMDGKFVLEKTLDEYAFFNILKDIKKPLDIHLMVSDPQKYIEVLKNLNPHFLTIHVEIDNYDKYIDLIHSYGIKAGIALNPKTRVMNVKKLQDVEYVLIMGVNPGLGGQNLIMETVEKISILNKLRKDNNYHYQIAFDGGVNEKTIKFLNGLDVIISGSYICMKDDYQEIIDLIRKH